jgi:hypothetical protein
MALFQGIFLLVIGIGLLVVTYQSLSKGWLPCGPNGLRGQLRFWRDKQPLGYWGMFGGYTAAGLWAAWYGIGVLAGTVEPLPLN